MILEKIKRLHKGFGHISNKECSDLGFNPRIESRDTLKYFLRKGKWSALNFSILEELVLSLCVKIILDIPGNKWPSYTLYSEGGGEFYASDMMSTLLFFHIERLNRDRELCERYLKDWDSINKMVLPVYTLFGGQDELQDIKDIIFDKKKWPKQNMSKEDITKRYKSFCLNHDASFGNQSLWNLLDDLLASKKILPIIPEGDLGIYTSRIKKLMGLRAWQLGISGSTEQLLTLTFEGFKEQHGYDTAELYPDYYPSRGAGEMDNNYRSAQRLIQSGNTSKISGSIKSQPEYAPARLLAEQGQEYFTGKAFLQAAAILDEEYNEPKRAWNCLVSAGYWAGENLPKGQDAIVKAAIYLCEKHNWLEAAEVLKYNLDIMQSV